MKVLSTIWRIIGGFIAFWFDLAAIIILSIGALIWAIGMMIKSPKNAIEVIRQLRYKI